MVKDRAELGFTLFDLKVLREALEKHQLYNVSHGQSDTEEHARLEMMLGRVRAAITKRGGV